jgi:hypothetical protein
VLWDVLAGLAVFPAKDSVPVATGLRHRPVPVEQDPAAGPWLRLMGRQLVEPLWRPAPMPNAHAAASTRRLERARA